MYLSLVYKVIYKDSPKEAQQTVTFPKLETAQEFAIAVEKDGGVAIVVSEYKKVVG